MGAEVGSPNSSPECHNPTQDQCQKLKKDVEATTSLFILVDNWVTETRKYNQKRRVISSGLKSMAHLIPIAVNKDRGTLYGRLDATAKVKVDAIIQKVESSGITSVQYDAGSYTLTFTYGNTEDQLSINKSNKGIIPAVQLFSDAFNKNTH